MKDIFISLLLATSTPGVGCRAGEIDKASAVRCNYSVSNLPEEGTLLERSMWDPDGLLEEGWVFIPLDLLSSLGDIVSVAQGAQQP